MICVQYKYNKPSLKCHICYTFYFQNFHIFVVPLPVSGLQEVQANDSALHVRWTKPDLTLTYFEKFVVTATSDIDTETWEIEGDKNEMIIMDLQAGTFYNVSVATSTGYETSSVVEQTFYTCKFILFIYNLLF